MKIRMDDWQRDAAFVEAARRETVREVGGDPDTQHARLLPFAHYFVMEGADGEPVGMAEAYFLDRYAANPANSPYQAVLRPALGRYDQVCAIRTLYVAPGSRSRNQAYMRLCLAAARCFQAMGARTALCSTLSTRHDLRRLYRLMGGVELGVIQNDGYAGDVLAFAFDLGRLLHHPLAEASAACLVADLPGPIRA